MKKILVNLWLSIAFTAIVVVSGQTYGDCLTPELELGVCVELKDCQELYALITPDISELDRKRLRQSQCQHDTEIAVCCPYRKDTGSLLLKAPECGTVLMDFIVGGNETKLNEFPWMALLEFTSTDNVKDHLCGGTLINERYVLTAAHCVVSRRTWRLTGVRLGEWDTSTDPDCEQDIRGRISCAPPHQDIPVEEIISHELYDQRKRIQMHDIALLRLARKVTFSNFIKPICLPTGPNLENNMFTNENMIAAGWGRTESGERSTQKLKATLSVWDLDDCRKQYSKQRVSLESKQLCVGGKNGVDTCKGDSGGPLFVQDASADRLKAYFQVGIVSFGTDKCAVPGWPSIYTRVGAYLDWIKNTIQP